MKVTMRAGPANIIRAFGLALPVVHGCTDLYQRAGILLTMKTP